MLLQTTLIQKQQQYSGKRGCRAISQIHVSAHRTVALFQLYWSWVLSFSLSLMLCFSFSIRQIVATRDTSHQQQGPDRSHQWEVHTGGSSEEVGAWAESQMWGVESCPVRAGPHHRRVALQICRVSDSSVAHKRVWFEITLNSTVCLMEIRKRWGMSFIHVSAGYRQSRAGETAVKMTKTVKLVSWCVHLLLASSETEFACTGRHFQKSFTSVFAVSWF